MKKRSELARGSVRLEVTGYEPERLLNFLAENGIEFRDTTPKNDCSLYFTANASDYPRISELNGKNGLEIKLLYSRGGKELTKAVKRRLAFFAMIVLTVAMLSVSSLFVWKIEISGNEQISTSGILRVLSESGVDYGAFWPGISSEKVRNDVLRKIPEISWLSVNINNSCARITVHERVNKPQIINKVCTDIIADRSGIVTKLSVLEGQAKTSVGETVTKGMTLISGTMTSETAEERYVHSLGEVKARTWYEINAQTPLIGSEKTKSKREKKNYSLILGKNRIFFFGDSRKRHTECDKIIKLRMASFNGKLYLPIGIMVEQYSEYETEPSPINENDAERYLKDILSAELKRRINGGETVSANYTASKDDNMLTVTLRAECIEEIGVSNDRENDRS